VQRGLARAESAAAFRFSRAEPAAAADQPAAAAAAMRLCGRRMSAFA
jgi:hypothetical protein